MQTLISETDPCENGIKTEYFTLAAICNKIEKNGV